MEVSVQTTETFLHHLLKKEKYLTLMKKKMFVLVSTFWGGNQTFHTNIKTFNFQVSQELYETFK